MYTNSSIQYIFLMLATLPIASTVLLIIPRNATNLPWISTLEVEPVTHALDVPPDPPRAAFTYGSNRAAGSITLTITNLVDTPLDVPISSDGEQAYQQCHATKLLSSILAYKVNEKSQSTIIQHAERYGCTAMRGSVLTLQKGQRVQFQGSAPVTSQLTYSYLLSDLTFRDGPNGIVEHSRGILDLDTQKIEATTP